METRHSSSEPPGETAGAVQSGYGSGKITLFSKMAEKNERALNEKSVTLSPGKLEQYYKKWNYRKTR